MRILRITASLMLTAGLAALVSISATWVAGASGGPWVAALRAFSIKFGLICLASAIGTLTLMPRQADVTRPIRPGSGSSPSPVLKTLLAVLAVVAVLQVPALARWWAQDRVLLDQIIGEEKIDSLGLALIPAVLLFSMPAVATVAVITFVLSSVLGSFARAQLTFPILAGCAALQAGLVVGERFVLGGVRSLGEAFSTATGSSGDTLATAQVTDWFGRHDVVASDTSGRLVWIFGGYLAVTLVSAWLSPALEADDEPDVAAGRAPEPDLPGVPAPGAEPPMPDVARFAVATVPAETPGPGVFSDSSYSVRPRRTLLDTMLMQQYATYDIQSIPPMARAKFSFSSTSGILRREPDGPDLAAVRADGRTGLVGRRTYAVEDLATGALLGRLVPSAAREWDIVQGSGNLVARVREESTGVGPWTYVAVAGDREMCRFTWALLGFTVQSAEMDVEFLEGWDGRFDRMLAIALAPMIEHRARVASQRSMS